MKRTPKTVKGKVTQAANKVVQGVKTVRRAVKSALTKAIKNTTAAKTYNAKHFKLPKDYARTEDTYAVNRDRPISTGRVSKPIKPLSVIPSKLDAGGVPPKGSLLKARSANPYKPRKA